MLFTTFVFGQSVLVKSDTSRGIRIFSLPDEARAGRLDVGLSLADLPGIDNLLERRKIKSVMKQQQRAAQKKLDYPETTAGSRLAAKARKLASKLTPEQRREHFNGAMAMIYGGAKEATLPRR
jgi:hypothetical protein